MTTPYIEVTMQRNIEGRATLIAAMYMDNDAVTFLIHDDPHNMKTTFDNKNQFLERVRRWGKALDIEVEENF